MISETMLIELITKYQLPLVFLGSFFFGETVILSSALLASRGILSLPYVFLLAFLGTIISDALWFYFGFYIFRKKEYFVKNKKYSYILNKINKLTGKRPFLALLFIKFLYGTRILTIVYLSLQRLKFLKFLLFNSIGTIIWLIFIISIGWLVGKGIASISIFNEMKYFLISLILFVLVFRMVTSWITKKTIEE